MSVENWNFLQSLPFGILVFGPSSDPDFHLPEQISDGDLDGDLYHVFWDLFLVNDLKSKKQGAVDPVNPISPPPDNYYGPASHGNDDNVITPKGGDVDLFSHPAGAPDDYYRPTSHEDVSVATPPSCPDGDNDGSQYFECRKKVGDKYKVHTVVGEVGDSSLKVQVDGETQIIEKDEVKKDMYEFEILKHKGTDLFMRYKLKDGSNDDYWVKMNEIKKQMPETISQYAVENNLTNKIGWKWTGKYIRDTVIKCVVSHEGDGSDMVFHVKYDDASEDPVGIEIMKDEAPDILYKYASKKDILTEWRKEYVESSQENWFSVAQDYNSQLKLLRDQSRLKSKLYEAYKKKSEEGDMEAAEAFSQAYKKALDLRKHACDIKLPNHYYHGMIPRDLQIYLLND